jgi:hypothetical protein
VRGVVRGSLQIDVERDAARTEVDRLTEQAALARARNTELVLERDAARTEVDRLTVEQARETASALELGAQKALAEALVATRDAQLAELAHALDQVRNSRLMRSTRALRRIYYKLR